MAFLDVLKYITTTKLKHRLAVLPLIYLPRCQKEVFFKLSSITFYYLHLFKVIHHIHYLVFAAESLSVPCSVLPADRQLCEQVSHGHSSAAALPGHPGVHGAQQSGSLPQGGARDHHRAAHPTSSRVSGSVELYEH